MRGTSRAFGFGLGVVGTVLAGCPAEPAPPCTEFEEVFVYADHDGDGFGVDEPLGYVCTIEEGQALNNVDCDDGAPDVHPDAPELCDLVDNDCNGLVDEAVLKIPWYRDADGDGFGDPDTRESACAPPAADFIELAGDCDDQNPDVNPAEREVCNDGIDDDCDRFADDADPGVDPGTFGRWFRDADNDGYGNPDVYEEQCSAPPGTIADDQDCDDQRPGVNPDGDEVCNRLDDDCDTLTDDLDDSLDPTTQRDFFADLDADTYGDADNPIQACGPVPGIASANDLDCDDTDPLANLDQAWYVDGDQDGYGGGDVVVVTCLNPGGGLVPETPVLDCDDADYFHNPATPEICDDGIDQNCDLLVDREDPQCLATCADEPLDPVIPIGAAGNTTGQGDDFVPNCGFANGAPDVAFDWTAPISGNVEIDLQGSNYDTVLHVYDGCNGNLLACNDDFFGLQSYVSINVTAGQEVIIVVDGYSNGAGQFNLNVY